MRFIPLILLLAACSPASKLSPPCKEDYNRCLNICASRRAQVSSPPREAAGTPDAYRTNQQSGQMPTPREMDCSARCDETAAVCGGASSKPAMPSPNKR